MSAKGRVLGAFGSWVLRDARIQQIAELGERLRRITLAGDGLRGAAWVPGDKVELVLPSSDVRTYTPTGWDGAIGTLSLVVYGHGAGPGAAWAAAARTGDLVRLLGPRPSVRVSGPAVVFGDETALGLAEALGAPAVFELSDGAAAPLLAERPAWVGIHADGERHLPAVADALARHAGATPVLVGRARSIQALRPLLVARGLIHRPAVKAYWADGKIGLDYSLLGIGPLLVVCTTTTTTTTTTTQPGGGGGVGTAGGHGGPPHRPVRGPVRGPVRDEDDIAIDRG